MLIKLRFIGLVLILLFSLSLFGQNYNLHSMHHTNKPQKKQNNYSTPLYDFHKSLNQLHEDLNEYYYVVDTQDLWFINSENMNFIRYQNKYQNGSLTGIPILRKNDIINILRKIYQDEYEYELKMNDFSMLYANSFDDFMETRLTSMYQFSNGVKLEIRNNLIPAIEDAIRNHPDNPQNPNNTLNDIVYSPEPSGATECHSIGSGSYTIGDKNTLGTVCTYYSNGRLRSETQYAHGQKHGLQRLYYNTGDLSAKGDHWNGRKAGVWRYPYKPGTYTDIEAYCREYDDNGKSIKLIPSC